MTRPRRARGGGYGSSWIRADKRLAIYLRDAFVCAYCGKDTRELGGPTLDHVDATGSNDATNLVVACRPCNNRKGDTALSAFLTSCAPSTLEARAIRTRIGRRTAAPIARHLADAIAAARLVRSGPVHRASQPASALSRITITRFCTAPVLTSHLTINMLSLPS